MPVLNAQKIITQTLTSWEGVSSAPHRFGGVEYRLGTRELGHIHGDYLVDIPFPKKVRDEIVNANLAEPHHILPDTGWISFYLRREEDVQAAIALLRRSYEIAWRQKQPRSETS
ncbi:MAG TPA: luciferase family protein [Anaerolineales bacterium]|nr:luciferase family protein [Anaerolineales bacterium]